MFGSIKCGMARSSANAVTAYEYTSRIAEPDGVIPSSRSKPRLLLLERVRSSYLDVPFTKLFGAE